MLKIGDFDFPKPPEVFREHKGVFFISGSFPKPEDAQRLKEILHSNLVLDLQYVGGQTRVLLGNTTFYHDVIWGHRYELELHEYTPLELTTRKIASGEIENIGEKMISPRFKVTAEQGVWNETIPKRKIIDYEVQLRVDLNEKGDSFRVLFKDQYVNEKARCDFSEWTTRFGIFVEILLGYLEQGDLLSVAKGKVTRISNGIVKPCNWVRLEGIGELRERMQQSVYLIKEGENLIAGRLERTSDGPLARVKTSLLPDLKPRDSIDVCCKNLGIDNIENTSVHSVTHIFSSNGATTQFTFVPRSST